MLHLLLLTQLAHAQETPVAQGARVFAQSCAVGYCHGTAGAANRGPRLAGRGFDRAYVEKTVRDGIPGTAMPGFKALKPADLSGVIEYVMTISGSGNAAAGGTAIPTHVPSPEPPVFPGPNEAKLGKEAFFNAVKGTRCGTCHSVDDWGTPIGPNLAAKPPSSAQAIRDVKASHVIAITTAKGEKFPALPFKESNTSVTVYDLTSMPPVLRSFAPAEIKSRTDGAWSHSAALRSYSDAELQNIVQYLKWLTAR